jgi:hypothetical protein
MTNPSFDLVLSIIRERIRQHRRLYEQNEMAVRRQLVEPLLQAIGWDPENPDQVVPNLSTNEGFPDYALVNHRNPVLFVEVKNLREDVEHHQWLSQLMRYAFGEGTPYGVLTNGALWILAASFKARTRPVERIIWKVDIETEVPKSIARKLETLNPERVTMLDSVVEKTRIMDEAWQTLLADSTYVVRGLSPILRNLLAQAYPTASFDSDEVDDYVAEQVDTIAMPGNRIADGTEDNGPLISDNESKTLAPPKMMMLRGQEIAVRFWSDILLKTATWLVEQKKLTKKDSPIISGRQRFLVNDEPVHRRGQEFKNPKQLPNGLWLEVHYSRTACIKHARELLSRYHFDPEDLTWR